MEISSTASRPPKPVRSAESPRYWAGPGWLSSAGAGTAGDEAGGAASATVWLSGRTSCAAGATSCTAMSLERSFTCVTT